jgi:hypothetical protein
MITPKITMTETPDAHVKQAIVAPLTRFNEAQRGRPEDASEKSNFRIITVPRQKCGHSEKGGVDRLARFSAHSLITNGRDQTGGVTDRRFQCAIKTPPPVPVIVPPLLASGAPPQGAR